jgi:rRNA maturation protein Nop10
MGVAFYLTVGSVMTLRVNTCAFCGTDVKQGFEICPGCGATYQKPAEARFRALCIGAFGFAIFLLALLEGRVIFSSVGRFWRPYSFSSVSSSIERRIKAFGGGFG